MAEPRGPRYDAPRFKTPEEDPIMRMPRLRAALVALCAVAGIAATPSALADGGSVHLRIVKAGFVIGGSAGSGTLSFHGRDYRLGLGGLSYGFTFGGSIINFRGTVSNISRPSDVAGVYAAGGVGAAAGAGAGAIVLTNQKGAVLSLTGVETGLMVAADLNGLAITVD
jgi:hypothetical protein